MNPILPFGAASTINAVVQLSKLSNKTSLHPVVHFKELHLKNIKAFERRLHELSVLNSDPMDNDTHDQLHLLLHNYCTSRVPDSLLF
jgi:hypothetical protein